MVGDTRAEKTLAYAASVNAPIGVSGNSANDEERHGV